MRELIIVQHFCVHAEGVETDVDDRKVRARQAKCKVQGEDCGATMS